MVRITVVLAVLLCIASCADIQTLTGGPKDEFAPKPVKSVPEQGALHVQGKSVTLTFDEYFKLQEPGTTLSMNPSLGKLTTDVSRKTLTVSWENELQPETTYILNFNGTIRDNNEGNDSIFQVVFSSGTIIDSLTKKGNITSAYSGEPISNATVALFSKDSVPYINEPNYLTRSDRFGNFSFSYLKDGEYTAFAYIDQNKNQKIDPTENLAYETKTVDLKDSTLLELRLFKPKATAGKLQVSLEKPGLAVLSGRNFKTDQPSINGETAFALQEFRDDSIRVSLPASENGRYTFTAGVDTVVRLHPVKDRNASFKIQLLSAKQWKVGDTLVFRTLEAVKTISDEQLIIETTLQKPVPFTKVIAKDKILIVPTTTENFSVRFGKNALSGASNSNDTISFAFETFELSECSTLILDVSEFDSTWVFELIDNANTEVGKVVRRAKGNGGKLTFGQLIPMTYSIRCFKDTNGNGKWDSGDYQKGIQPEEMLRFPIKQKLRPNWDVEEKLSGK